MRRLRPCRRSTRQTPLGLMDATPARLGEGRTNPPRPETRMAQGEGQDPLLGQFPRLVGHPRWPPLPGSEHLETAAQDRSSPAVVGRVVDAEDPAGLADIAQFLGQAEQPQPEPIQDVIIDHGVVPPAHRVRHDKHVVMAPLLPRRRRAQLSAELGDCSD